LATHIPSPGTGLRSGSQLSPQELSTEGAGNLNRALNV
jgi:hypothetical protein